MLTHSCVFCLIHLILTSLSVLALAVACSAVFFLSVRVYHLTPAAARRAFRRVPSPCALCLQVLYALSFMCRCQALLLSHEGAAGHERWACRVLSRCLFGYVL